METPSLESSLGRGSKESTRSFPIFEVPSFSTPVSTIWTRDYTLPKAVFSGVASLLLGAIAGVGVADTTAISPTE